jgi:predicted kinase
MRNIIMVRGISGSGKTTLANLLCAGTGAISLAADDYFIGSDGEYHFNPSLLPQAHAYCQAKAAEAMVAGRSVVIHNTFVQRWEMQAYLDLAEQHGYRVTVVSTYDGGCSNEELAARNDHGVPLAGIERMRDNWEADWKNGNPLPPWER